MKKLVLAMILLAAPFAQASDFCSGIEIRGEVVEVCMDNKVSDSGRKYLEVVSTSPELEDSFVTSRKFARIICDDLVEQNISSHLGKYKRLYGEKAVLCKVPPIQTMQCQTLKCQFEGWFYYGDHFPDLKLYRKFHRGLHKN